MSLMSCIEQLFAMTNLVPTPAAPPVFMFLFAVSLAYHIKPCGYCLSLIGILYLSLSPSSPFVSPLPSSSTNTTLSTDSPSSAGTTRYTAPMPDRGWLNWNRGRLFDPVLVGYQPVPSCASAASAVSSATSVLDGSSTSSERSESSERRAAGEETLQAGENGPSSDHQLPWGYFDLRWKGVGIVLDLGWRRTEEGMRWEGEVGQLPTRQETKHDEVREEGGEGSDVGMDSVAEIGLSGEEEADSIVETGEEEKGKKIGSRWRWPSFVGDL